MDIEQLWGELTGEVSELLLEFRQKLDRIDVSLKPDRTFLTEADVAVQKRIVEIIRAHDSSPIIAEEDERTSFREDVAADPSRVWVVDPIDGTAQFIVADQREYCSVVCLLEDCVPVASWVVAPELGAGSTPVVITTVPGTDDISVNGRRATVPDDGVCWISATRSAGTPPGPIESAFPESEYQFKVRTTSQTLDMVRTAVDLSQFIDASPAAFGLFYRERQKIWDGVAGMCLGRKSGLPVVRRTGELSMPLSPDLLAEITPEFENTLMGRPHLVDRAVAAVTD